MLATWRRPGILRCAARRVPVSSERPGYQVDYRPRPLESPPGRGPTAPSPQATRVERPVAPRGRVAHNGAMGEPITDATDLGGRLLPADQVGLLEGLTTTRAIRRYTTEPVPP